MKSSGLLQSTPISCLVPVFIPENIHESNIIWRWQVTFRLYLYINMFILVITISEKSGYDFFQGSRKGYLGGFGVRKGKKDCN